MNFHPLCRKTIVYCLSAFSVTLFAVVALGQEVSLNRSPKLSPETIVMMSPEIQVQYGDFLTDDKWDTARFGYVQHVYVFGGSVSHDVLKRMITESGAQVRSMAKVDLGAGSLQWVVPIWTQRETHVHRLFSLKGLQLVDVMRSRYTTHFPADVKMPTESWDELRRGFDVDTVSATVTIDSRRDFDGLLLKLRDEPGVVVENAAMWDDLGFGLVAVNGPRNAVNKLVRMSEVVDARLEPLIVAH